MEYQSVIDVLYSRISDHLHRELIPFWRERGVDTDFGGYFTCFNRLGELDQTDTDKYLVSQARMIWGFSMFLEHFPNDEVIKAALGMGVDFLTTYFWDEEYGGWFWRVERNGGLVDNGKVVYGQTFAIYALSRYYLATGDERGLEFADRTFQLLDRYCADIARGGYYENLEVDWSLSEPGFHGGDRKTLDTHMHLVECYTTLYQASNCTIHDRRLGEVVDLILTRMIDKESGCGLSQFDLSFKPIPELALRRYWDAERKRVLPEGIARLTSYGHNLELAWLLHEAFGVQEKSVEEICPVIRRLVDHTLEYGIDWNHGGIYRAGPCQGPALIKDKEWWQHSEALVGLIDAYALLGDQKYLDAFQEVWSFVTEYLIDSELGEWRTLVSETGEVVEADLGNTWKSCYHTGRAMDETLKRLDLILAKKSVA